jgi:glycosyltransferase involved in cell wall biosynthesis
MENKSNILIITFTSPYPATDGGKISIFGTVNYLRKYFNITLIFPTKGEKELENVSSLVQLWPDVKIHNVHYKVVILKKGGTFFLIKKGIGFCKNLFKNVSESNNCNLNKSEANNSNNKIDFFPFLPIEKRFINYLENLLNQKFYDIIQVEHTMLLNCISILPKASKKIFVQIENRYALLEDYFNSNNDKSLFSKYIIKNAMFTELNLMKEYDYTFSLNKEDKVELSRYMPKGKIFVAPFAILDSMHSKDNENNFEPQKLVFLGSQQHSPNEDAVKWFAEEICPFVNLKLYVTGKWEKIFIEKYPAVQFTGFIDDLSELMHNSIIISPIRLGGGGIRAKVLQAMAMKCPLISTNLSSMGLESLEHRINIFIANTAKEFISAINQLQNDKDFCKKLILNGYNLVQEYYSEKAVGEIRKEIYYKILA